MNNQFRRDLLVKLDERYDTVLFDLSANILEVTVNKNIMQNELKDVMKDLSMEIPYPFLSFKSDKETYTFSFQLMEAKPKTSIFTKTEQKKMKGDR